MSGIVTVKHKFVSQLEDSEEARALGELLPSDWNNQHEVVGAAPIDSPDFLGTPQAQTPPVGDSSRRLATMAALQAVRSPKRLTVTGSGAVAPTADVGLVVLKKTVPETTTITLPLSTNLQPETIQIKDRMLSQGAGAGTYNILIIASGTETIDGASSIKIDVDNMALTFRKVRNDAGAVTGEGYELV